MLVQVGVYTGQVGSGFAQLGTRTNQKTTGWVGSVFSFFLYKPESNQPDQNMVGSGWVDRVSLYTHVSNKIKMNI